MEKDTNPNGISSDKSLKSQLEGLLQKNIEGNISVADISVGNVGEQGLQHDTDVSDMVCRKMHKAMSPISAISGYLELLKMLLEQKDDSESLERYRSKIEEGVSEISEIVEDLYSAFDNMREENNDISVQSKSMISNENRRAS